jgi:hypothetical protein
MPSALMEKAHFSLWKHCIAPKARQLIDMLRVVCATKVLDT